MPDELRNDLRTPPHDLPAEQSVLGGMLLSTDAITEVVDIVRSGDFYRPAHQTVFEAAVDLFSRGEPVDAIAVNAELTKRGEITRVGGAPYLHTLTEAIPTAANAGYYARIVADRALLRGLVETGTRAAQQGYAGNGEASDLVDAAQADILALGEQTNRPPGATIGALLPGVMDRMEQMRTDGGLVGISTGLADLDSLTRGWRPGQLVVVGARPSLGKSTLAMDFARAAAIRHHQPTAFFSLEMGVDELTHRLLSAEAQVPLHRIASGSLSESDWDRIAGVTAALAAAPLTIEDRAATTVADIRATCRRLKRTQGLRLVVVDYLQILTPAGRTDTRQEAVAEMSRQLKLLAKELDVTVVALSQLNRQSEQRHDKRPLLSDLRESGSVEQDADLVILLHREDAYDKDSPRAGEADLMVAKHRNGPTAEITVTFQGHYSRFADMARP